MQPEPLKMQRRSIGQLVVQQAVSKKTRTYPFQTMVLLLNQIILSQLLFEGLEGLEKEGFYRHELKRAAKNFIKEIAKVIDTDYDLLIAKDDHAQTLYNLGDNISDFVKQLHPEKMVQHKPELLAALGVMLEQFHNAPELTVHRLGIKIYEELPPKK